MPTRRALGFDRGNPQPAKPNSSWSARGMKFGALRPCSSRCQLALRHGVSDLKRDGREILQNLIDRPPCLGSPRTKARSSGRSIRVPGVFTALSLLALSTSAVVMWWRRRPTGATGRTSTGRRSSPDAHSSDPHRLIRARYFQCGSLILIAVASISCFGESRRQQLAGTRKPISSRAFFGRLQRRARMAPSTLPRQVLRWRDDGPPTVAFVMEGVKSLPCRKWTHCDAPRCQAASGRPP
jgi:hypothetical protein